MTTGDSKAQQEHARENKQNKKVNNDVKSNQVVDKKLYGPNQPAE